MKKISVKNGIDNLNKYLPELSGARIGLITNQTGVDRSLRSDIDILNSRGLLKQLFSPEHGIRGSAQAGAHLNGSTDEKTGIPIYSLYGGTLNIPKEIIKSLDVIAFDIQDVGSRFYTYSSTLTYAMQDCAEYDKPLYVFDRINPIGGAQVEGTLLDKRFSSFVGRFPVATRHGLTIGEYARYINDTENIGCDLRIIPAEGWLRDRYFDETDLPWVAPSPNMPTIDTCLCYVGTCLAEGTNLSEGRGTTKPFETIGAPWLDNERVADAMNEMKLSGVIFRPCSFIPTFSKYSGELCRGIQLHITDKRLFKPFESAMRMFEYIRKTHSEFAFIPPENEKENAFVDLLLGTDEWRLGNTDIDIFLNEQRKKAERFEEDTKKYRIYG